MPWERDSAVGPLPGGTANHLRSLLVNLHWYDFAGLTGVILILIAYLMLQLGRWDGIDLRYTGLNLAGALLIILSLVFDFNLSAFLMEVAWVIISFVGIYRAMTARGDRPGSS